MLIMKKNENIEIMPDTRRRIVGTVLISLPKALIPYMYQSDI